MSRRATAVVSPAPASPAGELATLVTTWQRSHGRQSLPWQRTGDPYRVWLSEIMLQQTQVATVLGYYARFLERFPDVRALAAATLDDVLALWSGLGYYSRARNLHGCAQRVMAEHGGEFPPSAQALAQLPGIGRSTAAAIAAFCWGERVAILDGNVKRVLSRVLAFEGDLAQAREERALWAQATTLLPVAAADMPAYTQGLMDLGAGVCLARDPQCLLCPLREPCAARAAGRATDFPVKTRKLKRGRREHWWLWLQRELAGGEQAVWLEQRPARGVWAGLWTLPLYDDEAALQQTVSGLAGAHGLRALELQPTVRHALTHFDWTLHPRRLGPQVVWQGEPAGGGRWVPLPSLRDVALPAPLRKLLAAD
ncbi:MAG: A/G-specific adenine glycosylase [Burkholderiales bacterium]